MTPKSLICPFCLKIANWMHNLGKIDKDEHYICSKCKTKIFKQQGKKIGLIYFFET
jgi:transposase-like protein